MASLRPRAAWVVGWGAVIAVMAPVSARAEILTFFDASQGSSVTVATTSDTLTSHGYQFTYTRDYLFTGGTGQVIGRPVMVTWPTGLHAQYVTAGPTPAKASVTIQRVDGDVFDILAFTGQLLANAGAGRAFEVVPKLHGEEPLNDPIQFDCSGSAYNVFSYSHTPNYLGQTTLPLTGYDYYRINLTLDFALLNITVQGASTVPPPTPGDADADGKVDAFDLNALAAHWQQFQGAMWSDGDFTGEGRVDAFDLNILAGNWQFGVGTPVINPLAGDNLSDIAAGVPEPASFAMLLPVVVLLLGRLRRIP